MVRCGGVVAGELLDLWVVLRRRIGKAKTICNLGRDARGLGSREPKRFMVGKDVEWWKRGTEPLSGSEPPSVPVRGGCEWGGVVVAGDGM
jgi:hypothetical protein